jgi:hypothetical protein
MEHKLASDQVTIGADPFDTEAKTRTAFAKLNPNDYGVLPVLVVIQNDTKTAIDTAHLQVQYKEPGARAVDNTPASDVKFLHDVRPPRYMNGPLGGAVVMKGKKNPLDVWEIEGRAFAAKTILPGQAASGFFYFQAELKPGATIYIDGLAAATGAKQWLYFEIPLK